MNSSVINISEILNNTTELVSAGFSDGYNFDGLNAIEYFDELMEDSTLPSPIFSGILIFEKVKETYTVIDGLQRITTICLLLCALCENYKNTSKKNKDSIDKIFNRYLINENKAKLNILGEEQKIYKKILFAETLSEKEMESNLYQTYKSFLDKIQKQKMTGTKFFNIISKIQFMVVLADKSEVSMTEIYQSLNKNKNKAQINLISSFIRQKTLSSTLDWQKTVETYQDSGYADELDGFIKNFLTIQNDGRIPNKNALYNNFKSYFATISKYQDAETIIQNMNSYAHHYLKIIKADFDDPEIKEQILIIKENKGQDSYPYLMEVLDDLANSHINKEVFLDILIMISSFVKNRNENPLPDLTIDFASLSKELNKMLTLPDYTPKIIDENKLTLNEMNKLTTFEV